MAGYSGTPLAKKLGIDAGARVALVSAPRGFATTLDAPKLAKVSTSLGSAATYDVIVFFTKEASALRASWKKLVERMDVHGGLWIAWPKKASGVKTDVTEDAVRADALPRGLVDVKVCAIDATWSGLKLVRRRELRSKK